MSDPDSPIYDMPVFNTEAVAQELSEISAGFGQARVSASLERGVEYLGSMNHPQREVVLAQPHAADGSLNPDTRPLSPMRH